MAEKWYKACDVDELEMDDVIGITVDDKLIAVYQIKAGYYATDGRCSHENADMTNGYITGETVECPKHNATFNVITGEALKRPACVGIKTYPVKIENDEIYVDIS